MKKKLAILLMICLSAMTSWAGSTNEAVESLNRRLPLDASTGRLLSKLIYDEVNNIVVANYYTSWQNLVQMRKTPDFNKRAANEVLQYIFLMDSNLQPFTLVVNYFADEAGFEDLAKTYFVSPGQVATLQKAMQKNAKSNNKGQTVQTQVPLQPQVQEPAAATQPQVDTRLQALEARLNQFKGAADPQGRFQIARYGLSKDKKDVNIIVLATEEAMPFFIDEKYAPTMASTMSRRLAQELADFEDVFNRDDLNVAIYTADPKGTIKGQYKFPASQVFAKDSKEAAGDVKANEKDNGKDKGKDKDKSKKKKDKDKSKSKDATPEQTLTEAHAEVQTEAPAVAQSTSVTPTTEQTQTPAQSQQPAQAPGNNTGKKVAPEDNFQALIKLYQALLPQNLGDGVKLTQIKANNEAVVLLVEVDGEKYSEASTPQVRELLIKHLATEFSKKKSVYPLLVSLSCQSSRQFIYVLSSKGWSHTYPVPLEPCSILKSLSDKVKK